MLNFLIVKSRIKLFIFLILLTPNAVLLCLVHPAMAKNILVNPPFSGSKYEVEAVEANAFSSGQVIVNGRVKNTDLMPVKGYVVIYFLGEGEDLLQIRETEVNNKKEIGPGLTGNFKIITQIENQKNLKRVYVEFFKLPP